MIALSWLALTPASCSSSSAVECHVGADCASGACDVNGHCVPTGTGTDGGGVDGGGTDGSVDGGGGGSGGDGASDSSSDVASDSGICVPNNNGVINQNEVPMQAGLHATFVIAENVTVDTAGTTKPDGTRIWDLSAALAGDHSVIVTTDSPAGQWFSGQFTSATYTTRLSDTQPLLGVFQASTNALLLQGVVSPSSGTQQTELSYSPAVTTLAFPLSKGTSFSTNATVTGTADGIPAAYAEDYQSSVDATGQLTIPYGTFSVLRVKVVLTRTVGATVTIIRTYAFVTECFGTIASITSQPDEPNDEFSNAAEVRRLGK